MLITLPGRSLSLQNFYQIEGNAFNTHIFKIHTSHFNTQLIQALSKSCVGACCCKAFQQRSVLENLLKISMDLIEFDLELDPDPLVEHIRGSGLPLKMRPPTLSDGNCQYDAVADQIQLMKIPDKPTNHADVRDEVTKPLLNLPQTQTWIQNFFNNIVSNKYVIDKFKSQNNIIPSIYISKDQKLNSLSL